MTDKPTPKLQEAAYDWNDMVSYIEEKYSIDIRDYAGKWENHTLHEDRPYQDFWHWFSERYDVRSESYTQVYFGEDVVDESLEPWQREIVKLFVKEFGNEFRVWIEW